MKAKVVQSGLANQTRAIELTQSQQEAYVYDTLKMYFPEVIRQYYDPRYWGHCFAYIPINDLFIEYHSHPIHQGRPYTGSPEDKELLLRLKGSLGDDYTSYMRVWVEADTAKRQAAKENNLNFIEFFSLGDFIAWVKERKCNKYYNNLMVHYRRESLVKDYNAIQKTKPSYSARPNRNGLVIQFQQDLFYKHEKALWNSNIEARNKLITNRIKYIRKGWGDLTTLEVLRGFKISGTVKEAYSHFSPHWMRKFIEEYRVKSIYDPCGGWGHRLLACPRDFRYIYNDIREDVGHNVTKIANFLKMSNKRFYYQDAATLQPSPAYEAVFTCPPYWDLEKYSDKGAENLSYRNFLKWWGKVINASVLSRRNKPRLFAFVTGTKLVEDMKQVCLDKGLEHLKDEPIGFSENHFHRALQTNKKSVETLVVMSVPK